MVHLFVAALAMLLALAAGLVSYCWLVSTGNRARELTAAGQQERSPWPEGGRSASFCRIGAALRHGQQHAVVSPLWLVACFFALTIGELLVYPLSMALVTRLAPASATAAAMGLWMAAIAMGQWLAGEVASRWTVWSHVELFAALAAIALAAVMALALGSRAIDRAVAMSIYETQLH